MIPSPMAGSMVRPKLLIRMTARRSSGTRQKMDLEAVSLPGMADQRAHGALGTEGNARGSTSRTRRVPVRG